MTFKTGDLIAEDNSASIIVLILEVNERTGKYKAFILRAPKGYRIRKKFNLHCDLVDGYINLKDLKLNEI